MQENLCSEVLLSSASVYCEKYSDRYMFSKLYN